MLIDNHNYSSIRKFENVYLEDSFVLDVEENFDSIKFRMEIVLMPNHPRFTEPKINEAYCYKNGEIIFPNIEKLIWIEKKMLQFRDLDNEIDYGNIDQFFYANSFYHLSGDWGKLKIKSAKPTIEFIED